MRAMASRDRVDAARVSGQFQCRRGNQVPYAVEVGGSRGSGSGIRQ